MISFLESRYPKSFLFFHKSQISPLQEKRQMILFQPNFTRIFNKNQRGKAQDKTSPSFSKYPSPRVLALWALKKVLRACTFEKATVIFVEIALNFTALQSYPSKDTCPIFLKKTKRMRVPLKYDKISYFWSEGFRRCCSGMSSFQLIQMKKLIHLIWNSRFSWKQKFKTLSTKLFYSWFRSFLVRFYLLAFNSCL